MRILDNVVSFVVNGIAQQQGSKNPWGGESNKKLRPWRAHVTEVAAEAMNGAAPLHGPVRVEIDFFFPRPKAHYRTGRNAHLLRETAPIWHTTYPDCDKLQRAIGDSLTGVVVRDDKQIASWVANKRYDERARAEIHVISLEEEDRAQRASAGGTDRTDRGELLEGDADGGDRSGDMGPREPGAFGTVLLGR